MRTVKSNRIAFLRKKRNWSQQQLADAVNSHWVTISKLERSRMQLTQDWLEKIASALGVLPYDLLPYDHDKVDVYVDGELKDGILEKFENPK